jgi:hypothetical protein
MKQQKKLIDVESEKIFDLISQVAHGNYKLANIYIVILTVLRHQHTHRKLCFMHIDACKFQINQEKFLKISSK